MEITGKFIKALPLESGTSTRGNWSKQSIIIETLEQYPKKICVTLWGERINNVVNSKLGDELTLSINIESREYNNRWYTEVRAWKIVDNNTVTPTIPDLPSIPDEGLGEDLPF